MSSYIRETTLCGNLLIYFTGHWDQRTLNELQHENVFRDALLSDLKKCAINIGLMRYQKGDTQTV